jgi:predicted double-glycine peptidase
VTGLQQGGAVVVRLHYGCWHYVLLTDADEDNIYLFDPYYRKKPFRLPGIEMIWDKPAAMNRRVPYSVLNSEEKSPYALGPKETREAVVFFNEKTRRTPQRTIEYFI